VTFGARRLLVLDAAGRASQASVAAMTTPRAAVYDLCEIDRAGALVERERWQHDPEAGGAVFRLVSFAGTARGDAASVSTAVLHDSPTVDFGIVVTGTIALVDSAGGETTLGQGDAFSLHGGPHAWRPLSEDCALAVVLVRAAESPVPDAHWDGHN
jgi:hypothetical protein